MTKLPKMFRLRQIFDTSRIYDIAAKIDNELSRLNLGRKIKPGQSVAVTVGSRGIPNLQTIVRSVVDHLKRLDAIPFVVPAMGSHGGATADGQRKVIESYGITGEAIGCEIRSSMETVVVCQTDNGLPVYFDRYAHEADHVLICNRVKPHTRFVGPIESGLMKMMLIGLGKRDGAEVYHRAIEDFDFDHITKSISERVLSKCKILAGLAIVDNALDQTSLIEAIAPNKIRSREPELLKLARQRMPKLPFQYIDLLIIDQIGKNISGTGLDTNVVGRKFNNHKATEGEYPKIKRIALRGLSRQSYGNAVGIGLAEFCRSDLLNEANLSTTAINAITAKRPSMAMQPLAYETDHEMLEDALSTIGLTKPEDIKVVWIKNTLELTEIECSATFLEEANRRQDIEVLTPLRILAFDDSGNLLP